MPYQNFDDRPGGSKSQEKLECLRLPRNLEGMRVLDLGCNEGFFCIEAKRRGAAYVLGVDKNRKPIELARERAQSMGIDVDFSVGDFTTASNGPFDIVLLLSALHYADNPKAVLDHVYELLSPNGLFILECGVADLAGRRLHRVLRSIDERYFPSLELLRDHWLDGFCVRRIGRSVDQGGDPIPRFVFHCTRRKPSLVLVSGRGSAGKTNIAARFTGALLIETDALVSGGRHKSRPLVSKQQAAMDEAMVKHDRHIGNAWDEAKQDPEIVQYFADIVGKMIAINPEHDLIVVEGYMVGDLSPALLDFLDGSHVVWNLSAEQLAPAPRLLQRRNRRRHRVR